MKKGKSEGTTELAHKVSPFLAAVMLAVENRINPKVNSTNKIDKDLKDVNLAKIHIGRDF